MKRILLTALSLILPLLVSAQDFKFEWEQIPMDGSRVGASIPSVENLDESIGVVRGKKLLAPNGKKLKGSVAKAAGIMRDAQPLVASVKEVVGYSTREMIRTKPECELSNMIVDQLMAATEKATGRHVDVGITNHGGIRVDMPQGNVLMDDILSMLPFVNYLCYVELQGSDLRVLLEQFASAPMAIGGVRMTVKDNKLVSATVGGEALDDNKVYGVATVDFLLDGGDRVFVARNAKDLVITDVLIRDALLSYLKQVTSEGKNIEYSIDGRYEVLN